LGTSVILRLLALALLSLVLFPAFGIADDKPAAAPAAITTAGFHDDSEGGIVIVAGNAQSQSYNLLQGNTYGWDSNLVKLFGKYLQSSTGGVETAKYWTIGVRYERELSPRVGVFAGQLVESDVFSGYNQRYSSDVGGKYVILKEDAMYWNVEAGYRYTVENRQTSQVNESFVRLYTEASRNWTKTFSTTYWLEGLPNLSNSEDYQINTSLSASAALNDVFAIKLAYLLKYRNILVGNATVNTDTQYSTSLVAKF
jgi:putative salt-induced outer membrane protein